MIGILMLVLALIALGLLEVCSLLSALTSRKQPLSDLHHSARSQIVLAV